MNTKEEHGQYGKKSMGYPGYPLLQGVDDIYNNWSVGMKSPSGKSGNSVWRSDRKDDLIDQEPIPNEDIENNYYGLGGEDYDADYINAL